MHMVQELVQFEDLRRCLIDTGQYKLVDTYQHFAVSRAVSAAKTGDETEKLYKRFRS